MGKLAGKHIVLGVTGSIAAFKAVALASLLTKEGALVRVIETENALKLIGPSSFQGIVHTKVLFDTFDQTNADGVSHIDLASWTDAFIVAPASADVIAKLARGIADDMLTTTFLANTAPVYIAPAMNTHMYENPATQENLRILKSYGYHLIEPAEGNLACGVVGKGRMAEPADILYFVKQAVSPQDLTGKKVLVTAGPTAEAIDPVRFITNHSTGKMGYAVAAAAAERGADVTLVSGPVSIVPSPLIQHFVPVTSAADMYEAVTGAADAMDAIVMAAAVADYTPAEEAPEKVKKKEGDLNLPLVRTRDILGTLGEKYRGAEKRPLLVGFSMETEHVIENSRAKLEKKGVDMIVANSLRTAGAGFGTDTNVITLITKEAEKTCPIMSKADCGEIILDEIFHTERK